MTPETSVPEAYPRVTYLGGLAGIERGERRNLQCVAAVIGSTRSGDVSDAGTVADAAGGGEWRPQCASFKKKKKRKKRKKKEKEN